MQHPALAYSDAARRIADEMALHAVAKSRGFAVFSAADGRPFDHVPYPTHADAVRATGWDRERYLYLEIQADGGTLEGWDAAFRFGRTLLAAGYAPVPEHNTQMPLYPWDRRKMVRHLATGGRAYPRG